MQLELWHINGEGFHWGRHGLGQEESGWHVPSDTLFAALVARLAELRGVAAVEALVGAARADPPFVLSSAFPRAGQICFFPMPLRPPTALAPEGPRPKDLKKVKFVSAELFRALSQGQALADLITSVEKLHSGQVLLTQDEHKQLPPAVRESQIVWKIEKRPRVAVGRVAHNSQIYFTGRTTFQPDCGLWFGVRWIRRDDILAQTLAALWADLGDAGLGGVRNSGFGRCEIKHAGSLDLPDANTKLWVSLGRYLPRADEMDALRAEGAAYTIETVGGWVDSPVSKSERRRAIRVIAEGAVLGQVSRAVPGQIADVQPDYNGTQPLGHPVWRSGLALAVGLRP